jgi:ADP-dependent NAD(P)H-hydrate dehydratase / NAD(P)H-hydrate epimerase
VACVEGPRTLRPVEPVTPPGEAPPDVDDAPPRAAPAEPQSAEPAEPAEPAELERAAPAATAAPAEPERAAPVEAAPAEPERAAPVVAAPAEPIADDATQVDATEPPPPTLPPVPPTLPPVASEPTTLPATPFEPGPTPRPSKVTADAVSPAPAPARSRWRRRLLVAAGIFALLCAIVAVAHGPIVRSVVTAQAGELGLDIEYQDLDVDLAGVTLKKATIGLQGVTGVRARADSLELRLGFFKLSSAVARPLVVQIEGHIADRLWALRTWSVAHPDLYRIESSAHQVRIEWREKPQQAPWLVVTSGTLVSTGKGQKLDALGVSVLGLPLGAISASWPEDPTAVTIDFGKVSNAEAPLRVVLRPAADKTVVDAVLQPFRLASLGRNVPAAASRATLSGKSKVTLTRAGAASGTASFAIEGWVPAHDKDLAGILHGKRTALDLAFTASEDRSKATLRDVVITAGALRLKGGGTLQREGDHGRLKLDLKGAVPCTMLAKSAASANLGDVLGQLIGEVSRRALEGSVAIDVQIDADTRDLARATVKKDVRVGCKVGFP